MTQRHSFRPSFIVIPFFLLLGIGIVEVWSSSYYFAYRKFGDPNFFLKREILFVLVSIVSAFIFSLLDYRILKKLSVPIVLLSIFLLLMLHINGVNIRGAVRWLRVGRFLFEPSGFAKLALLIYLADFISRKHKYRSDMARGIFPIALITGVIFLLIALEPDVGTALLVGLTFLGTIYVFDYKPKHILLLVFPIILVSALIVYAYPEKLQRVINFFITDKVNYQIEHALIALGSGGILGAGPAKGVYKSLFVPDSYNDFIMAGIGEDFGLLGVFLVIFLLLSILMFIFAVSKRCRDSFGKALSFGIGLMLSLEALMNLFSVYHLMPPKGITMPFLSYGGTSLLIQGAMIGVVLSIYRYCEFA